MNVASLELCEELYELSGWDSSLAGGNHRWCYILDNQWESLRLSDAKSYQSSFEKEWFAGIPAYDLGYLLRKLPRHLTIKKNIYHLCIINGNAEEDNWVADYVTVGRECWLHEGDNAQLTEDANVENALCNLAIQLFKECILVKEATL